MIPYLIFLLIDLNHWLVYWLLACYYLLNVIKILVFWTIWRVEVFCIAAWASWLRWWIFWKNRLAELLCKFSLFTCKNWIKTNRTYSLELYELQYIHFFIDAQVTSFLQSDKSLILLISAQKTFYLFTKCRFYNSLPALKVIYYLWIFRLQGELCKNTCFLQFIGLMLRLFHNGPLLSKILSWLHKKPRHQECSGVEFSIPTNQKQSDPL